MGFDHGRSGSGKNRPKGYLDFQEAAAPGKPMPLKAGQKLFPPLTFLPFHDKKVAINQDGILNTNHDFTQWLLETAPTLRASYPGIFKSIRRAVLTCSIQQINENLDRLRTLRADVSPSKRINLSSSQIAKG